MIAKRNLKERKAIQARMTSCNPLIREVTYAFQQPEVVALISTITFLPKIEADPLLYAAGMSAMGAGHFPNPPFRQQPRHRPQALANTEPAVLRRRGRGKRA